jgi:hypothetical protein
MPKTRLVVGVRTLSLDARPDRLDLRDRPYIPPLNELPSEWPIQEDVRNLLPAYAQQGLILDQGSDGACTGFGLAAVINYQLFIRSLKEGGAPVSTVSAAMLYQLARLYDEWPGEDYEGSSCRGALKGWHRHGVCRSALWPYKLDKKGKRLHVVPEQDPVSRDDPDRNWDVDALARTLGVYYRIDVRSIVDMQAAIRQNGAIYVSATVHEGWSVPSKKQLRGHADLVSVKPVGKPKDPGGHAFALIGYNVAGFVVQNSWGPGWGSQGFALLPYEDWVVHGQDAWVFTLGVPGRHAGSGATAGRKGRADIARSPRFLISQGGDEGRAASDRTAGLIGAADGLTRRYLDSKRSGLLPPLDADQAYSHTIVLDRGLPVRNDILAGDAAQALDAAVLEFPLAWFKANGNPQRKPKLVIYAHGGLNSESDSITRIRVLAPYALANGIYPLFVTWRSGPLETLGDMVQEAADKFGLGGLFDAPARGWADRITDATDRLLEPVLRGPGGALWGQMKLNAVRASEDNGGGMRLTVERLQRLRESLPELEIHLVGHSAGAIVLGAMLARMKEARLKVASLRLFAPACTVSFALKHYVPAVRNGVLDPSAFHIHVLSDANELDDSVGPYRKSLLYLVSRAFEDVHKMPLLGMVQAFEPDSIGPNAADGIWATSQHPDVRKWQEFWASSGAALPGNPEVLKALTVSNGARMEKSTHGCFDNAVEIMGRALGAIVNPVAPPKITIARLDY